MPSAPSDRELTDQWKNEPAPLLPMLHAFHDRDGHLSEASIRAVSDALKIPIAELYGTVTFYHHFSRDKPGKSAPRVCTGNVCCLHGAGDLLESLEDEGATPMPCSGRCDDMIPVIKGDSVFVGLTKDTLVNRDTPLPPPNPGGLEECVFRHIRAEGRSGIDGYRATGGYAALEKAVAEMSPESLVELVTASKLAGRGGAGFPTGVKWKAVADAPGDPKTIVCNADEGEPGCFKDRAIMDHDPHGLIEGMILAAYATGAPARLHLPALRVPGDDGHPAKGDRRGLHREPARREHPAATKVSPSSSTSAAARAPTSAARKVRCSTASRANTRSRATSRRSPSRTATRTSRPSSTTSRRWPASRTSCARVRAGI